MAAFFLLILTVTSTVLINAQDTLLESSPDETRIGRTIDCTKEEKRCFTHSRLLNEKDKLCYIVGSRDGCSSGTLYLDKEMLFKTGRYVGKCLSQEPCKLFHLKTPNGDCVEYSKFCSNGTRVHFNLFGEPTCVSRNWTLPNVKVQQPEEPDLCRVPNFWSADNPVLIGDYIDILCSEDEFWCFLDNRILWPVDGLCYETGYREPCKEPGYWLVVDEEEYLNGTGVMTPVCRPRPCPEGHLLMQFDRKCYSREDVEQVFCLKHYVLTNSFGYSGCVKQSTIVFPNRFSEKDKLCTWNFYAFAVVGSAENIALSACPASDTGYCPREIIRPEPSLPEL